MSERPRWNFWLDEQLDDRLVVFNRPDSQEDIRHESFDLDVVKWCDEIFWSADEATLISFFRDPEKIKKASTTSPLLNMNDDYEEHNELLRHMIDLHDLIEDAQRREQLPGDFFPAAMYVKWAKRMHVDLPPSVLHQLDFVERERRGEVGPLNIFEAARFGRKARFDCPPMERDDKIFKVSSRAETNSNKIILALLKTTDLFRVDVGTLSKRLSKLLEELADETGDNTLKIGTGPQTIASRLKAAHELLK